MSVDAILPAGGRLGGAVAREAGTDVKALLQFGATPLLVRTLTALRATSRIRRAVVVGPEELKRHAAGLAEAVLPETSSGAENIFAGLRWLLQQGEEAPLKARVLILTTDLPFLTPEAVTSFLDACPPGVDLCVPVIERREFEQRFTRSPMRYVHLRDGAWMIGCAFLMDPAAITRNQALIDKVFAARRSQLGMARLLGLSFLLRFAARRLTVRDVQLKRLRLLGCTGAALRGCAPELGFDIDHPADYHYAMLRWGQA